MTYAATIGGAGIAAWAATKYFEPVIIGSTCLLGSYAMIRGAACYLGHYYNEFEMANMVKNGLASQIDPFYWAYVGGFFILAFIGWKMQQKQLKKQKAKEAAKKKKGRR